MASTQPDRRTSRSVVGALPPTRRLAANLVAVRAALAPCAARARKNLFRCPSVRPSSRKSASVSSSIALEFDVIGGENVIKIAEAKPIERRPQRFRHMLIAMANPNH